MTDFVLFAVGSAVVVDFVESCRRSGDGVAAGIANRDVPSFLPDGVPALAAAELRPSLLRHPCLVPLFTPANRFAAAGEARQAGFSFPKALVDPTAILASDVAVGGGSYVNAGVVIGAQTSIGEQVFINRAASIGHHGRIGDFASLGPGVTLAGQVTVGRGAMIGAGAVIVPGITIGEHAVVGAGAIVIADVPAYRQVLGRAAALTEKTLHGFGGTRPS